MTSPVTLYYRSQLWQWAISFALVTFLLITCATHSIKDYHWFLLLAIPWIFIAPDQAKQFFKDWGPLLALWIIYDRMRLIQPYLLGRVSVEKAYFLELWAFGWLSEGALPAHAARAWLRRKAGTYSGEIISWGAQLTYFSHLIVLPGILLCKWYRGWRKVEYRPIFELYMFSFLMMHILGYILYLLLPVAPPWWVSLHGFVQPTAEMVSQLSIANVMDGVVVQKMIETAPNWFAAVPSLHGAYPFLLLLLVLRERKWARSSLVLLYGVGMGISTVLLNQHYIIDLVAGFIIATAAMLIVSSHIKKTCAFMNCLGKTTRLYFI